MKDINLEILREKRREKLNKKYKNTIEKYTRYSEILEEIELVNEEDLEVLVCKIYILTDNISITTRILNENGYRILSSKGKKIKIRADTIKKILRNINYKEENNKYKKVAKEQYTDHGGLIRKVEING